MYITLSGLFDVYPNLRIGFAECSAGWLPAWLNRLEGQVAYMSKKVPHREMSPTEYAQNGRIFCCIELYEGSGREVRDRPAWRRRADVLLRLPA